MRLNKSRENISGSPVESAPAPIVAQEPQSQGPVEEEYDEDYFPVTQLDPIHEEEEPVVSINLLASIESLATATVNKFNNKKNKNSKSKASLKALSADNLKEEHEDMISPIPNIQ